MKIWRFSLFSFSSPTRHFSSWPDPFFPMYNQQVGQTKASQDRSWDCRDGRVAPILVEEIAGNNPGTFSDSHGS